MQFYDQIPYLKITVFDVSGRRLAEKRLKTKHSERNVALHPALIDAGFLQFVGALPSGRMFPDLPKGPNGTCSHQPSKWFGAFLDGLDLDDPALVFHSFRHGFRDACDAAGVAPDHRKALGGWAGEDVADKYGKRDAVPVLYREVCKLSFGGFSLDERPHDSESSYSPQMAS